ncbi:MAG: amylo-alpha-1,6-glucosidase [Candidatus Nanohaloarchaea archaeon]
MKYNLRENLDKTSGTISNLHGFLHVFNDHGFRNKWTGYWAPPYKFLDYYSLKINGVWLSGDTINATEYGENFVFHHELDSLQVDEKVETPDSLPGLRITIDIQNRTDDPKAVRLSFEPGIDIRHKSNDIWKGSYEKESDRKGLTVSGNDRKLMISSGNDFEVEGEDYIKEHHPGEKQRCYVPGELVFSEEVEPNSSREISVELATSDASFGVLESEGQELVHGELGRCFQSCIGSMENLVYDREGKGVIAGHPWFQSYWARDSFWTVLGLIDAGHHELSREILENFADRDLCSRVFLEDGACDTHLRADSAPLFVIACDKLDRHYGITGKLEDAMGEAMEELELDGNIVAHEPEGTWMDTLERSPAVDIQSLWLEAAEITNDPRAGKLEQGLQEFRSTGYMKDHMGEDAPETINPAVPLMLGQLDSDYASSCLEKINAEFSSMYGARTRSMADPGYRSDGYHSGSAWGLTTGWAAAANLRYGNEGQGLNLLKKITQFLDRHQLGALPEVVDAESGELTGAPEQAWSAAMFTHVVDTYLLGIDVREDHVRIEPADISCERKGKKIRGERLDIAVDSGEVEILNDPGLDIRL